MPSCSNLLKAQISQIKLNKGKEHNLTQYLDNDKENMGNFKNKFGRPLKAVNSNLTVDYSIAAQMQFPTDNFMEDSKSKDSIGSSS